MSEILENFTPAVLAKAIEANQIGCLAALGGSPQSEVHNESDMLWFASVIPLPLFNGVCRAQFRPDDIDARIDETLARFKSRGSPMIWWTGPSTQPLDLGKYLEAHGLTHANDLSGMAVDLLALNEGLPRPPDLTIERVDNVETLERYMHPVSVGFQLSDFAAQADFHVFASLGLEPSLPLRHYIGWQKGEPVASSILFLGAGVAGVHNVATVPEARRQGIGTAMTLAPLHDARTMGYRIGVLQSSRMGFNVYRRIGFEEYCTLGVYVWEGETNHSEGARYRQD